MALSSDTYLSTAEVAGLLGVTTGRVRQFVIKKRLNPAKKFSGVLLFDAAEVLKFARIQRKPGAKKKSDNSPDCS